MADSNPSYPLNNGAYSAINYFPNSGYENYKTHDEQATFPTEAGVDQEHGNLRGG